MLGSSLMFASLLPILNPMLSFFRYDSPACAPSLPRNPVRLLRVPHPTRGRRSRRAPGSV